MSKILQVWLVKVTDGQNAEVAKTYGNPEFRIPSLMFFRKKRPVLFSYEGGKMHAFCFTPFSSSWSLPAFFAAAFPTLTVSSSVLIENWISIDSTSPRVDSKPISNQFQCSVSLAFCTSPHRSAVSVSCVLFNALSLRLARLFFTFLSFLFTLFCFC